MHNASGDQLEVPMQIQRLDPGLPIPSHARRGDAGIDLYCAVDVVLQPGQRESVPTGIAIAVPSGFAGLVTPRSGLAARAGLSIVNAPGVIDSGYRGEVCVLLINLDSSEPVTLRRGDRIAQLLLVPVAAVDVVEVAELPESDRGSGGFGSTGR